MTRLQLDTTLQAGDEGYEVTVLYQFLQELGYLPGEPMREVFRGFNRPAPTPTQPMGFNEEMEHAVAQYQELNRLHVTGSLDDQTLARMRRPRCAFPDVIRPEYVLLDAWEKRNVTYHFNASITELSDASGRRLRAEDIYNAFRAAFKTWQNGALNQIRITEAATSGDIEIYGFTFAGTKFGGTYPPQNGDVYMDRDGAGSGWSVTNRPDGTLDLESGVLHELGHALGLDHSSDGTAMDPSLDVNEIKRGLADDDIAGIRALYPR